MAQEIKPTVLNLNGYIDLSDTTSSYDSGSPVAVTDIADTTGTDYEYAPTKDTNFLIYVQTTDSGDDIDSVTVKAGDYFQDTIQDGSGGSQDNDLVITGITLSEGEAILIGPLESARFLNSDGKVEFTVVASASGQDATLAIIEISYEEE